MPGLSPRGLCSVLQALDLCSGKPGPRASRREPCPADTGPLSPSQQGKVRELVSSLVGDQAESAVPASHLVLEMPAPPEFPAREGRDKGLAPGLGKPEESTASPPLGAEAQRVPRDMEGLSWAKA